MPIWLSNLTQGLDTWSMSLMIFEPIFVLWLMLDKTHLTPFAARKLCHAGSGMVMMMLSCRTPIARLFIYMLAGVSLLMTWEVFPTLLPNFWFGAKGDKGITLYLILVCVWVYAGLPLRVLAPVFLADPAGAVVGKWLSSRYPAINPAWLGNKTVGGSAAVFTATFLTLWRPQEFGSRACVSLLATLGEAVGGAYDNLVIALVVIVLILGLLGMASSAGINALAHSVTFGINLAVFTNLVQYMYTDTKRRRSNIAPHWRKWGPVYCVIAATFGVMADLTRHLINDANNWFLVAPTTGEETKFDFENCQYVVPEIFGSKSMCGAAGAGPLVVGRENALGMEISMYNEDGSLSVYGWLFTIIGTWTGVTLLFVGIFWYANIGEKLRSQFARLQASRVRNDEAQEAFLPLGEEPVAGFVTPFSEPTSPLAATST